jgi:hypothetical protein
MSKSVSFYRAKDDYGRSELRALPRPDGAVFVVTRSQTNAKRWNIATHVSGFTALRIVSEDMTQSEAKEIIATAVKLHGEDGATRRVYALAKLATRKLETVGHSKREHWQSRFERVAANLTRGDGAYVHADASGDGYAYVLDKSTDARTELVNACDSYRASGDADSLSRVQLADAAVKREQEEREQSEQDARLGIDWTRVLPSHWNDSESERQQ